MKREQFSDRIGNIEDRLLDQAENAPNFGRIHRNRRIRRAAGVAAVLALMVVSFTVGAVALAKAPEIVYVEREQPIITIGDSGISLVLPDDWAGKYGVETNGNNIAVYQLAQRNDQHSPYKNAGYLFWVDCLDGVYPMDYSYPEPGYTIATTATNTYRLKIASDVQYDSANEAVANEYVALSQSISNIKIQLSDWMANNSTNAGNWVEGTAIVSFVADGNVTKTVTCDEAQSQTIREIVQSQDYGQPGSFYTDLWIMVGGDAYYLNSATGDIMKAAGGYSAILSAEDLSKLMEALNQ